VPGKAVLVPFSAEIFDLEATQLPALPAANDEVRAASNAAPLPFGFGAFEK
jgi:hypothetical protein